METLPADKAQNLAEIGRSYVDRRRRGEVAELGAMYAFQKGQVQVNRRAILDRFGWSADKPIIAVYSAAWFDFPHGYGNDQFRDFSDWILATLNVAREVDHANWLFKGHPIDEWYKGETLTDVLPPDIPAHIRIVPDDWSGSAVMQVADAIITYHGTVGVEASTDGTPVLLAGKGWYSDFGFALCPRDRNDYLNALRRRWWEEIDRKAAAYKAQVFAGWYFCMPDWQENFIMDDSSGQSALYEKYPDLIRSNRATIDREIAEIADWFESGRPSYHVFKMGRASNYLVPGER
jgi:capsule polysaccharide export protein KpsC/LpsZ